MYALTVNDIDAQTYARICPIPFEEECSLSQALHRLISVALERYPLKRKSSFARFAGRWTAEEAVAFNELTRRAVDEEEMDAAVLSFDHHMKALMPQGVRLIKTED